MSYYQMKTTLPIPAAVGALGRFHRSGFRGLGDGAEFETKDPPASYYCKQYIDELAQAKIGCQTALSSQSASCGAAASATAYGAAMREKALNERIAALQSQLSALQSQLAQSSEACSTAATQAAYGAAFREKALKDQIAELQKQLAAMKCPPQKSCLFWIITTVVASGVAIAASAKKGKKDDKKKPELPEKK